VDTSILIVEKDDIIRGVLRDWLESVLPGLDVIEAASSEESIALAQARLPHLFVIVVGLLRLEGIKAIRHVRVSVPSVEVVALTVNGSKACRDEVMSVGASACISVWKMRTELLPTLKTLLTPGNGNKTE